MKRTFLIFATVLVASMAAFAADSTVTTPSDQATFVVVNTVATPATKQVQVGIPVPTTFTPAIGFTQLAPKPLESNPVPQPDCKDQYMCDHFGVCC